MSDTAWRSASLHVVGFDDAPFSPEHRGDVLIVGAVFAGTCLHGVLSAKVRRDGANATRVLARVILKSRFQAQLHAILLQGIAFAGFNVIDLQALYDAVGIPVMAVSRRAPDLDAIRRALLQHVRGGARKWRLIERAGPMELAAGVYVQRCGITQPAAQELLARLATHSRMPEPLRAAHLIAAGITLGESRHRA